MCNNIVQYRKKKIVDSNFPLNKEKQLFQTLLNKVKYFPLECKIMVSANKMDFQCVSGSFCDMVHAHISMNIKNAMY